MTAPSPSFSTTISRKRRKRAATEPCGQAVRWPSPPRSAPACHVLLDAEDMHTQCHSGPAFPLLPCDSMKEVSAPPCSRAGAEMVWWMGRGSNKEKRRGEEEKAQHLTHTCTTCCLCLQVWHAGGGGHGLVVVLLRFLCTLALAWG